MPVETFFQAYVDALSDPAPEPPRVVPGERSLCRWQRAHSQAPLLLCVCIALKSLAA